MTATGTLLDELVLPEHTPTAQLHSLSRIAAALCGTATAAVTLLDGCSQQRAGAVGLDGGPAPLADSLCAAAVREPRLRHVPDARLEPAFADSPWVDGRLGDVRFSACAPMVRDDGRVLGTLCVWSTEPGSLTTVQRSALDGLAGQAVALLGLPGSGGSARELPSVAGEVDGGRASREALRRSQEEHRLLFDAATVGMLEADEHGVVLRANPAVARLLGHDDPSSLVGRPTSSLVHPLDRSGEAQVQVAVLAGHTDRWDLETVHARADGSPVQVAVSGRVVRRPDGSVHRCVTTLVDLTERVAARAALELANTELARARDDAERRSAVTAAVLDTIDVAVVACDASGALTLFNRAAREFHGVPEDRSSDPADWADRSALLAEDGRTPLARDEMPLARALLDGQVAGALAVLAPDGLPVRTVRCDGQAMRDAAGRSHGAVVVMRDVTADRAAARELTEARDQALAATRAKTAFLAAASHEIRTPLNGVLGTLELLAAGTLTDQQGAYVQVARRSGEALLTLLDDVLDLSKAETTSVVLTSEPFSPCDVAADVLAALAPVARRKGLDVDLVTGRDELLLGDAGRLRQVLMNLVGNAVKFTEHGRIGVAVQVVPGHADGLRGLRLVVTDTGAGMASDEVARLFQPFVQGAQGERHGGTGLGLALSQQLVELMGGQVLVGTRLGHGTRFTVELDCPQAEPVVPAVPQAGPAERPPRLRVLVADDGEVNLLVSEALLVLEGAEVVTVGDGRQAVDAVRAAPFDLVLLDRRMPRLSGPEAARAIRALPGRAGRTRLVALTASADEADHEAFAAAGVQGVLLKPVSREDLRAALADAAAERLASTA